MRHVKGLLARSVDVVELLAGSPAPLRLSEIAATLDLPKSATHRLLQELAALGWVEQEVAEGRYRLTLRFALLGSRGLRATGLPELARPLLQALADGTRELARLTLAIGDGLIWLASAQGAPAGLMYQPSMDGPLVLHATANGKAFLAVLPPDRAEALARAGGLGTRRPTAHSLTGWPALADALAAVRARGYALAEEEAEPGVTAVAVAILGADSVPVGTVSVAGPSLRLPKERYPALAAALAETALALAGGWPAGLVSQNRQTTRHPVPI